MPTDLLTFTGRRPLTSTDLLRSLRIGDRLLAGPFVARLERRTPPDAYLVELVGKSTGSLSFRFVDLVPPTLTERRNSAAPSLTIGTSSARPGRSRFGPLTGWRVYARAVACRADGPAVAIRPENAAGYTDADRRDVDVGENADTFEAAACWVLAPEST